MLSNPVDRGNSRRGSAVRRRAEASGLALEEDFGTDWVYRILP